MYARTCTCIDANAHARTHAWARTHARSYARPCTPYPLHNPQATQRALRERMDEAKRLKAACEPEFQEKSRTMQELRDVRKVGGRGGEWE